MVTLSILNKINTSNNTKISLAKVIIIENQQLIENIKNQMKLLIKSMEIIEDKYEHNMNYYINNTKKLEDNVKVKIKM